MKGLQCDLLPQCVLIVTYCHQTFVLGFTVMERLNATYCHNTFLIPPSFSIRTSRTQRVEMIWHVGCGRGREGSCNLPLETIQISHRARNQCWYRSGSKVTIDSTHCRFCLIVSCQSQHKPRSAVRIITNFVL